MKISTIGSKRSSDGKFLRVRFPWSLDNFDDGYLDANGRVRVYSPGHPRSSSMGYVLRAIVAYEKYHSCSVPLTHVIHHKDHVRTNDNIENLEMLSRSEHSSHHNMDRKNDVNCICQYCKKTFIIQQYRISEGRGKFCGQACYHKFPKSEKTKLKTSVSLKAGRYA